MFSRFPTALPGLLAAALLATACHKDAAAPDTKPDTAPRALTAAERSTVGSANDFAYRIFGQLRQPAANVFISPLSISAALTMTYNGADGATKAAMQQTLGFAPLSEQQINESYQSLFALLGGLDSRVTFAAANSLWYNQRYQLQAPFVQTNQTYFGATVQGLDFGAPAAAGTINSWVADKTQGKIPRIVDRTTADDALYLVNALYFKGSWTYAFDPRLTQPLPFHHEDGSQQTVDFMHLTQGRYRHYADAGQDVIDLPYGNRQYSMTLVVPRGSSTLADVVSRLSSNQLSTWLAAADTTDMELYLPKFQLSYEQELSASLRQLGMGVAFGGQADFSRMLQGVSGGLQISEVRHKTFVAVDEQGTEAAAATSVGVVNTSVPAALRVDRPFVFLIREKSSGAVLFIGQLTQP